ncbi:hypothetical protein MJO28_005466, partial [Puccinia striiformis f. sp. tritici]
IAKKKGEGINNTLANTSCTTTSNTILDTLPNIVLSTKWCDILNLALATAMVKLAQGRPLVVVHYSGEWNKVTNQVILPTPQWAAVTISPQNIKSNLMKWANTPFPPFLAMYQLDSLILLCLTKAANYVQEGYDPPILTEQEKSAAIQMRALSPKLATGYLDQPSKDKQLKWCMAGLEPDKQYDILTRKRIISSSTNSIL